jgi:tripartite ATP-independent transporter DctM subunit
VATETPIGDLFIAAVIPGILVTAVFIAVMMVYLSREKARATDVETDAPLPEKISTGRLVVSMTVSLIIVVVVFGGIYSGMVTPTEAGAVGSFAGFLAALVLGKVNGRYLVVSLTETVKVTVMVMIILIGAQIFGRFVSLSLIPRRLIDLLEPLVDQPFLLLMIIAGIYFVLFMFVEGAAVILMSVPVLLPVIEAMGTDITWFGVFIAMICTVGLITPPVGLSVYAVSGATGIRSDAIFRYAMVFAIIATVVVSVIMIAVPETATWLPSVAG